MRAVGYYRQIKPELHSPKNTRESYVGSPRVDIERFCLEESHNLIHLIGSEHRETSETEHFGRLMEQLSGPFTVQIRLEHVPGAPFKIIDFENAHTEVDEGHQDADETLGPGGYDRLCVIVVRPASSTQRPHPIQLRKA